MIFFAGTGGSQEVELGAPASVELRRDEGAPADSLSAVFPLPEFLDEYLHLTVRQGNSTVFDGLVDEQRITADAGGRLLRLECRSRNALLLDNEALPQQYERPSLPLLFGRHAAPYGFSRAIGDSSVFSGTYTVAKGMSEWAALSGFCEAFLGTTPRITSTGTLDATGTAPDGVLIFSQNGGIPCYSLEEAFLPCELLSEVWTRAETKGGYDLRAADEKAMARGILRRRYCGASADRPAALGEAMLRNARGRSYRLTLSCPGWVDAQIGQAARVQEPLLSNTGEMQVCALRYREGPRGRNTQITLRKKEVSPCGYHNNSTLRRAGRFSPGAEM